ncbi:MAG: translation initiation factor IF-2 subunit gamma [Nanoarchaeota archaeon]
MPRTKKIQEENVQPEVNIGLVGHIDHGKTTLVERLSGKWTDTHSEELRRGITIRLGYADFSIYSCKEHGYNAKKICENCKFERKISLIDAPGHESLMATMLAGTAIIDGALLVIAANESCPQPQTKEHLIALDIIGIKNIVIAQNKIDLVTKEEALKNYKQIKEFIKGTIAENSPIIPISAQHNVNIDILLKAIQENIKISKRDETKDPLFYVARSFDINKPGAELSKLKGGVLGGTLKQGVLKLNQEIEIKPGLKYEREGKTIWQPLFTKVESLMSGGIQVKELKPRGSAGVLTQLDPSLVKADSLTGSIVGLKDKLPEVWYELNLKPVLLERVVGSKEELKVEPIKKSEFLMLNVNSAATVGLVTELKKDLIHIKLKIPVCSNLQDRITISRRIGTRWRLIGYSSIVK